MGILVVWYVHHGGILAVIKTDSVQFPIIYAAFTLVILRAATSKGLWSSTQEGIKCELLLICTMLITATMFGMRRWLANQASEGPYRRLRLTEYIFISSFFISLAILLARGMMKGFGSLYKGMGEQIVAIYPKLFYPFETTQGIAALITFTILNLTWQLIDTTSWQRIQSLMMPNSADKGKRILKNSILASGVLSTCTWALAMMAGVAFSFYLKIDVELTRGPEALAHELSHWGRSALNLISFDSIVAIFVFLGCVAMAMSTADSCLAAATYVTQDDILRRTYQIDNSRTSNFTLMLAIVAMIIYTILVRGFRLGVESLSIALVGAYAIQLVILPIAVNALSGTRRRLPTKFSVWTGISAVSTILCGFLVENHVNKFPFLKSIIAFAGKSAGSLCMAGMVIITGVVGAAIILRERKV